MKFPFGLLLFIIFFFKYHFASNHQIIPNYSYWLRHNDSYKFCTGVNGCSVYEKSRVHCSLDGGYKWQKFNFFHLNQTKNNLRIGFKSGDLINMRLKSTGKYCTINKKKNLLCRKKRPSVTGTFIIFRYIENKNTPFLYVNNDFILKSRKWSTFCGTSSGLYYPNEIFCFHSTNHSTNIVFRLF